MHQQKNKSSKDSTQKKEKLLSKGLDSEINFYSAKNKTYNKKKRYCIRLIRCENENVSRNGDSPFIKQKTILDNKVVETSYDFLVNRVPNFKTYPK